MVVFLSQYFWKLTHSSLEINYLLKIFIICKSIEFVLDFLFNIFSYILQALSVCPSVAATYSDIGLVQALMGHYEDAVITLHKALSLHRDQTTATTLLNAVMEQITVQNPAFQGISSNFFIIPMKIFFSQQKSSWSI